MSEKPEVKTNKKLIARSGLSILWVENGKKIFNRISLSKCETFAKVSDR